MTVNVSWDTSSKVWALEGAIVDLDGTMVDTMGDFTEALNRMLLDLRLPALVAAEVEPMVGKGTEHLLHCALRHVLAKQGATQEALPAAAQALFAQALERYMHHYIEINGAHSAVYAGVMQGLQALKQAGLRLACVTNKPLAFTTPLLRAKGLDGLFDVVFGGDSFARKKPDPLPLHKACEALGTLPAQTVMIGDSSNDAQAGRAAGCPVLLVTYGYNHGQPVQAVDADGWVDSLALVRVA